MTRLVPPLPVRDDAEFAAAGGLERLWLSRRVATEGPVGLFIGLNPSTAGATLASNDHTITKECEFARRWGWSGFWKVNLFTCIETMSAKLRTLHYDTAVGGFGDRVLEETIPLAPEIVVCWGNNVPKNKIQRIAAVTEKIRALKQPGASVRCFGLSKEGHPMHPLRLAYDTPLVEWALRERVSRR